LLLLRRTLQPLGALHEQKKGSQEKAGGTGSDRLRRTATLRYLRMEMQESRIAETLQVADSRQTLNHAGGKDGDEKGSTCATRVEVRP
jgi:hypothetical protein